MEYLSTSIEAARIAAAEDYYNSRIWEADTEDEEDQEAADTE
jgi:hypothetical protein